MHCNQNATSIPNKINTLTPAKSSKHKAVRWATSSEKPLCDFTANKTPYPRRSGKKSKWWSILYIGTKTEATVRFPPTWKIFGPTTDFSKMNHNDEIHILVDKS